MDTKAIKKKGQVREIKSRSCPYFLASQNRGVEPLTEILLCAPALFCISMYSLPLQERLYAYIRFLNWCKSGVKSGVKIVEMTVLRGLRGVFVLKALLST